MADEQLSIFISYSRANSEFVDRLEADLRARGYKTWVDRRRLEGGQEWEIEINTAIADCDLPHRPLAASRCVALRKA